MGFIPRRRATLEELESESEALTVETEVAAKKQELAERESIIAELKSRYGSKWSSILGAGRNPSLSTLRSFLKSAKTGLDSEGRKGSSIPVGHMYSFKGMPKA